MFFHLFVCFCINLFWQCFRLRCPETSREWEVDFYHLVLFNKVQNDRRGSPFGVCARMSCMVCVVWVWLALVMRPKNPWNVSYNRKCAERILAHTVNGVWLGINACACLCVGGVCVCTCVRVPAGCFYSAQVVILLFPPVCLLFHPPISTILVAVPDKKRPHSKDPLPERCLPPDIFQSFPLQHTLSPSLIWTPLLSLHISLPLGFKWASLAWPQRSPACGSKVPRCR